MFYLMSTWYTRCKTHLLVCGEGDDTSDADPSLLPFLPPMAKEGFVYSY